MPTENDYGHQNLIDKLMATTKCLEQRLLYFDAIINTIEVEVSVNSNTVYLTYHKGITSDNMAKVRTAFNPYELINKENDTNE